jgi:hypothetical protein
VLAAAGLGPLEAGVAWRLARGAESALSGGLPSTMARKRVAAARMVFACELSCLLAEALRSALAAVSWVTSSICEIACAI